MSGPDPYPHDAMRPGELATAGPLPEDASLVFVGRIETPWRQRSDCPRRGDRDAGPVCRLVIDPRWAAALDGIEEHAELQLLYWMGGARRDLLRLVPSGGQPRGTFATRAPTRPNPIASSIVTRVGRDSAIVTVRGLDCINGTPLLDVKPWRSIDR